MFFCTGVDCRKELWSRSVNDYTARWRKWSGIGAALQQGACFCYEQVQLDHETTSFRKDLLYDLNFPICQRMHCTLEYSCQDDMDRANDQEDAFLYETDSRQAGTNGDCRTKAELDNPKLMEMIRMVRIKE